MAEVRNKLEAAAKAKLHGVEMPKQIDFSSKKLYHEYLRFKTITKKILECYEGVAEEHLIGKVLMWMGPDACVKHANHPFSGDDSKKMDPLWNFFDRICAKKEGTEGSWNAARMWLKFIRQQNEETVDKVYDRIRDVLHQCEYDEAINRVMEAETLKYGITDVKILEKVYALPKTATANDILGAARAEEAAQRHMREVEKVKKDYNREEPKSTDELRWSKLKKTGIHSSVCQKCGQTHPPRKCPAFGKECGWCKKKNHYAKMCRAKGLDNSTKPHNKKHAYKPKPSSSDKKRLMKPKRRVAVKSSLTLT